MPTEPHEQDLYKILAIPPPNSSKSPLTAHTIKLAYRRALLLHHPDKTTTFQTSARNVQQYTIDEITQAYQVLIDPAARSEYDRQLKSKPPANSGIAAGVSYSGIETVDLDELTYDEVEGIWYRACRCGKDRAYVVAEEALDMNEEYGELMTGCQGCSIWLRVTFAVAEDWLNG